MWDCEFKDQESQKATYKILRHSTCIRLASFIVDMVLASGIQAC